MSGEAAIVHINVIGFMAAVELARDRSLADRPFVVAAAASARSAVMDCSRRALREGVKIGENLSDARRRLPDLLVLPPNPSAYQQADSLLEKIACRYAPVVENDTGGHLYLDLSGTRRLFGPYVDSAARLRNELVKQLNLDSAVTLAGNKLVAKIGTRSVRPDGFAVVRPGDEAAFLAPQTSALLPGVGPGIKRLLDRVALNAIGDIASLEDSEALALFGAQWAALRDAARGRDVSPVAVGRPGERSLTGKRVFVEPILDQELLRGAARDLAAELTLSLRRDGLAAGAVRLFLRYADGAEDHSAAVLKRPLRREADFLPLIDELIGRARRRRLRLSGLSLSLGRLTRAMGQLDLFEIESDARAERFQAAADAARGRFGFGALTRASALASRSFCVAT